MNSGLYSRQGEGADTPFQHCWLETLYFPLELFGWKESVFIASEKKAAGESEEFSEGS